MFKKRNKNIIEVEKSEAWALPPPSPAGARTGPAVRLAGGRAASQARLAGEEAGAHDSRLDWVVVVNSSSMGKVKGGGDD